MPCLTQTIDGIRSSRLKVSALELAWYMRNQLLRDTDWANMAHAVEVRVPLVDVELLRAVAHCRRAGFAPRKRDMAAAPCVSLPGEVLEHCKTGFTVPVREWLMEAEGRTSSGMERGLRRWARLVYSRCWTFHPTRTFGSRFPVGMRTGLSEHKTGNGPALRHVAMLATEVCTHGGIQSFMQRVLEVMDALTREEKVMKAACFSLNDSTAALQEHAAVPSSLQVWGAGRSKWRFLLHCLVGLEPVDVLLVGHVALAPVAYALQVLGLVRAYVVILHGIEAWRRLSFLERQGLRGARHIIATTGFTAEECARHNRIPWQGFRIIPLCADERDVKPSPEFRLNGAFKVLCVARQDASERYKGFDHLLQAQTLLKATHPGIHLNLVGQGDDQPRLRTAAEALGLAQQVTFWGSLCDEDLAAAYEDCDVFAMPSKKEGLGLVFLEAMQRGKPCIGGNHGGTPDVIEHGKSGFLVEYGDVPALTEYIWRLYKDPALRRVMGRRGRQLVQTRFSQKVFLRMYEELIMRPTPQRDHR